ncbi:MAG TPA: hydrogenase iron-sulfur subunit [Polyangia bacterium]
MSNIGAAIAPQSTGSDRSAARGERVVVAFICENCARPGLVPSSGIRRRPTTPDFAWPFPVGEVVVPCAGRLQPEHFLKAFEDGADAIGVICCEEGNCHHLEGNRRCSRRLDYVSGLLEQVGLGANRLMIFHLPGSAVEDMALGLATGASSTASSTAMPVLDATVLDATIKCKIAEVREQFVARLASISRNPLCKGDLPDQSPYEVDSEDESDE